MKSAQLAFTIIDEDISIFHDFPLIMLQMNQNNWSIVRQILEFSFLFIKDCQNKIALNEELNKNGIKYKAHIWKDGGMKSKISINLVFYSKNLKIHSSTPFFDGKKSQKRKDSDDGLRITDRKQFCRHSIFELVFGRKA